MKMYYLAAKTNYVRRSTGVFKKIQNQIDEMNNQGIETHLIDLKKQRILKRALPFATASVNWDIVNVDESVDAVYIRYLLADKVFLKMLKRIKQQNPKIKIIVEIPTYPYDKERTLMHIPLVIKDRLNRTHLYQYVDRITTFSVDKEILGVLTIKIINGIIVDDIAPKKPCEATSTIHVLAVASLAIWHGYDRFLNGLGEYYKSGGKRNICFHIVGDGKLLSKYKNIVVKNNIESHVIFYGAKTGQELDEIYDKCEIAIESIGWHRNRIFLSSTLKSREYLAKGLPIITACKNDILDKNTFKYFEQFPADETPIDIEKTIEFYDNIYIKSGKSKQEIIDEIREFAYNACDMKVTMKPIIDYIKGDFQ